MSLHILTTKEHKPTCPARSAVLPLILGAAITFCMGSPARAATTFTVDTNRSVLALSGTIGGVALVEQAPGSLMGHYTGKLMVEVTNSTLTLLSNSVVTALNGGEWEPLPGGEAGRAPANYGGQAYVMMMTIKPAIRGGGVDLSGGNLTLARGQFSCLGLALKPVAGTKLDFNYVVGGDSQALTQTMTNAASGKGMLKTDGANLVLTIPVDASASTVVEDQDVQYRVKGRIVARGPAAAFPGIDTYREPPKASQAAPAKPESASEAPATPADGPKPQAVAESSGQ
jgi:hypothetical protein